MGNNHKRTHIITSALLAVCLGACDSSAEAVGPEGGTRSSQDGRFTLDIPAGALQREIELSIDSTPCPHPEAVGECYALGPKGIMFLLPAEVAFELSDELLDADCSVDADSLGVVTRGAQGWSNLADRDVDTSDHIIYASAMYLSTYALVPLE